MTAREKLIELLRKAKSSMWGQSGLSCELARNSYIAEYLIANGVTFASDTNVGSKWIPVTERLPEERKDVLVFGYYHEAFQILICHYRSDFNGEWFTSVAGQKVYDVTHWMPLPEPPKEE